MCTAEKPFRAAGTGLGKESLSTKLVPGKIAGSMHSNLVAKEVAITASSTAPRDLPSMASLDINKPVREVALRLCNGFVLCKKCTVDFVEEVHV